MVKKPYIDENGLRKGAWSPEEDDKLRGYILRYGHWNWRELPKFAGLARCGKSCRLRWINYLQPNVKHGAYSKDEEETIIKLHDQLGNKWSAIAKMLPGRTDNEIKNYWHTRLKKCMQRDETKIKRRKNRLKFSEKPLSKETQNNKNNTSHLVSNVNQPLQILESCPISSDSPQSDPTREKLMVSSSASDSDLGSSSDVGFSSRDVVGDQWVDDSFWNEPFMLDYNQNQDMEFNFLDQVMLSPYMSYVENIDFTSILWDDM